MGNTFVSTSKILWIWIAELGRKFALISVIDCKFENKFEVIKNMIVICVMKAINLKQAAAT